MRQRLTLLLLPFTAFSLLAPAQEPAAPQLEPATTAPATTPVAAAPDNAPFPARAIERPIPTLLTRINGLFDIDLPQLYPPGTFNLDFNPHFSDLVRRDYIRVSTGVRWALNDHFGLDAESLAFLTHHLRHGNAGYGLGLLNFGAKYLLRKWPDPAFETSLAFSIQTPVGRPPIDLTDGRNHYTPSFVTQYHPRKFPRLTPFAGANFDYVTLSSVAGTLGKNTPGGDSVSFTSGVVYDLGQIKWTMESTFTTTALTGGPKENIFSVQPSFLWFVPKRFTLNSKTQWIVGLGVRSTWGPDGYEFSTNSRVRAEITFWQFVDRLRHTMDFQR